MRVIHVSPTDIDGGAAKGSYNLHRGLQRAGVDSMLLVQRKYSDDPSVIAIHGAHSEFHDRVRDRLDRLPLGFVGWRGQNWWTVGWIPFDVSPALARLKPDIVQFHWAGRGAAAIESMKRLRPYHIVWTLRDMWPLTGGCHYTAGCEKFLTECRDCPQLRSSFPVDLARWQWFRKFRSRKDLCITYIALSNWLADYARRSPLVHGNEVSVIPNGVDTDVYAPMDKAKARASWGLPADKRIALFGAVKATSDPRKGYVFLQDALARLAATEGQDRLMLVVFGADSIDVDTRLETRSVGWVEEDRRLAQLYACADVMVVPSLQENLGKTAIESMACGVPVAAFDNTGMPDIVDHRVNGYLAGNLSADDLAAGIAWCLEQTAESDRLQINARNKVIRCFDLHQVAARYIDLYHRLLQGEACAAAMPLNYKLVGEGLNNVIQEGLASKPAGTP
ncbi:MAG: glycosyltransferase family 4 protein [Rhodospirillales bacterium]|jgi:glycosyltransferase involved in cell wall biosynthesis|nr:glycosyltransferase family 4 protein [Rhodospirillales bacterium]